MIPTTLTECFAMLSAFAAFAAAAFWFKVALIRVPKNITLTVDRVNFDDITKPLARQSFWNGLGAASAGIAAIFQVISIHVV